MDVREALKSMHLDAQQAEVYLACLALGSAKAQEIATKAGILRTTAYSVLATLQERGLVSTVKKDDITQFQAATPQRLVEMLEEKTRLISTIVPDLEKLRSIAPTTHRVELFEGREGLKTVINDFLATPGETIHIIGFVQRWVEFSTAYASIYYRKKKERRITTRAIVDEAERKYVRMKGIGGTQFRFLDQLQMHAECIVYRDKVAYVSFEDENLHGIIIQDAHMAALQLRIFEQLWTSAKP